MIVKRGRRRRQCRTAATTTTTSTAMIVEKKLLKVGTFTYFYMRLNCARTIGQSSVADDGSTSACDQLICMSSLLLLALNRLKTSRHGWEVTCWKCRCRRHKLHLLFNRVSFQFKFKFYCTKSEGNKSLNRMLQTADAKCIERARSPHFAAIHRGNGIVSGAMAMDKY